MPRTSWIAIATPNIAENIATGSAYTVVSAGWPASAFVNAGGTYIIEALTAQSVVTALNENASVSHERCKSKSSTPRAISTLSTLEPQATAIIDATATVPNTLSTAAILYAGPTETPPSPPASSSMHAKKLAVEIALPLAFVFFIACGILALLFYRRRRPGGKLQRYPSKPNAKPYDMDQDQTPRFQASLVPSASGIEKARIEERAPQLPEIAVAPLGSMARDSRARPAKGSRRREHDPGPEADALEQYRHGAETSGGIRGGGWAGAEVPTASPVGRSLVRIVPGTCSQAGVGGCEGSGVGCSARGSAGWGDVTMHNGRAVRTLADEAAQRQDEERLR
ncbi:hypothetical protein LTR08_001630 [Meristemomyces frigidus]|nr:hypothetical protein LTR08_001630 [Meristemomyces frigidus]